MTDDLIEMTQLEAYSLLKECRAESRIRAKVFGLKKSAYVTALTIALDAIRELSGGGHPADQIIDKDPNGDEWVDPTV